MALDLPVSAAGSAAFAVGAGFVALSAAGVAEVDAFEAEGFLDAGRDVFEADFDQGLDVNAALGPAAKQQHPLRLGRRFDRSQ